MNDISLIKYQIHQPLILISQIQRSGGSMMVQLFDGHSQIFAHPLELKLNKPKWDWSNFNNLYLNQDLKWRIFSESKKFIKGKNIISDGNDFLFNLNIQKRILNYFKSNGLNNDRKILNAYFTSFFNAFENYKNYNANKSYVAAFTPKINITDLSVNKFFSMYPDGYFITIIRNPKDWLASAFFHAKIYSDVNQALTMWLNSSKKSALIVKNFNNSIMVNFENLIKDTEYTMKKISNRVEIKYEEILKIPTFNSEPTLSNSSFKNSKNKIIKKTLERWNELSLEIKNSINQDLLKRCIELYNYCSANSINSK